MIEDARFLHYCRGKSSDNLFSPWISYQNVINLIHYVTVKLPEMQKR